MRNTSKTLVMTYTSRVEWRSIIATGADGRPGPGEVSRAIADAARHIHGHVNVDPASVEFYIEEDRAVNERGPLVAVRHD